MTGPDYNQGSKRKSEKEFKIQVAKSIQIENPSNSNKRNLIKTT